MNHPSDSRGYSNIKVYPAAHTTTLNHGSENEMLVTGYRIYLPKLVVNYIFTIISLGFLQLVFYWKPVWHLKCTSTKCQLREATVVLIQNQFHESFVENVKCRKIQLPLTSILPDQSNECPDEVFSESISEQAVDIASAKAQPKKCHHSILPSSGESDIDDDRRALIRPTKQLPDGEFQFIFFEHKKGVYYWNPVFQGFLPLQGLERQTELSAFYDKLKGYSKEDQAIRQGVYGLNEILIEVKSYFKLFVEEILNPFYIFQIFSMILWGFENYYYYAACIVAILIISICISLYETKKQSVTLRDMVAHSSTVTVLRESGETEEISSRFLVPGDVILIPRKGCIMSCDAALITGNCIVNESMLTGESVPVTKTPLPNPPATEGAPVSCYDVENHKRHTLFGGTHVIQTRSYGPESVKAVIIRTGFLTMKGELVRSILFPKPVGFKFYRDSMKFIGLLVILALAGIAYSIATLIHVKACIDDLVYKALDIITIAVPPSLPAAMTVGTVYAQNRLKKRGIFCISPQRINICGKLKLICFDKTGTLTEDGLDLWGVVPLQDSHFLPAIQKPSELTHGPIVVAMATCHSLTIIDGKLSGDPLDLKMFEATNWILEEPGIESNELDTIAPTVVRPHSNETFYPNGNSELNPYEIGIVRQFPFSSALQRMSVVTRTLDAKHMEVYVKGSPEMITSLCNSNTVPLDFQHVLQSYTEQGFRVLALAWRQLDPKVSWHHVHKIPRGDLEANLTFLGLLVLQNALKSATTPVIAELHNANIRTVMVTGDNMLTAVSVAQECRMIPTSSRVITVNALKPSEDSPATIQWISNETDSLPDRNIQSHNYQVPNHYQVSINGDIPKSEKFCFAVSGKSFQVICRHFPDLLPKIVQRGAVFARMAPDDKAQLIEAYQDLSYCVGMCGDGANDCGALKTAHAGISLSEAEASVASPFTSKIPDISCVPIVIKEGRAALVTSFGVFKFMALYSVIQFVSVVILYWINSNLGDLQFLYVDLVITTTVAILMGHNGAYPYMAKQRPPGSLFSFPILLSILIQVFLVMVFQVLAYLSLHYQPWFPYEPHQPKPCSEGSDADDNIFCPENTVVFIMSSFQYILLAGAFSKGPPYRLPIWRNYLFVLDILLLCICTCILLLVPARWAFFRDVLQIDLTVNSNIQYPLCILALITVYAVFAYMIEAFIVDSNVLKSCLRRFRCKRQPKNKYKLVEREIVEDESWPPVGLLTETHPGNHADMVDEFT
ncbi:polyamine-transporting ATPase 13A3-like isoform X2 [Apostichopus japonicus]|uniref:polyamine-transporting ATPase 13A3-like isoform X2 n=1 Tax=Stichopus japonicus TaxID=307972 RepID=UPI003AB17240